MPPLAPLPPLDNRIEQEISAFIPVLRRTPENLRPQAIQEFRSRLERQGLVQAPTPQRNILEQAFVGAVRGPFTGAAQIPRALSAVPELRSAFEPVAEAIESIPPRSSGGAVESGFESATAFLTNLLLFRGGAGVVSRFAPTIGKILSSQTGLSSQVIASFGGAEFAQTRQELEQINERLPQNQKIPTDEITRTALISAVAEGGFEALSTPLIVGRLLRLAPGTGREAIEALTSVFRNPTSFLGRSVQRLSQVAASEVPTEALTAATQAGARQAVLEPRGIDSPSPVEAARASVVPTLISAGVLGAVIARRDATPQEPAATEIQQEAATSELPPGQQAPAGQELVRVRTNEVSPQQQAAQEQAVVASEEQRRTRGPLGSLIAGGGILRRPQAPLPAREEMDRPLADRPLAGDPRTLGRGGLVGFGLPGQPRRQQPAQVSVVSRREQPPAPTLTVEPTPTTQAGLGQGARVETRPAPPPGASLGRAGLVTPREQAQRRARNAIPTQEEREQQRAIVDPAPTPAQAQADNYQKGHLQWQGLPLTIEAPKGGERRAADGSFIARDLPADYGYIRRTEGVDGEQVDVYVGDNLESETVYVVDQVNSRTGEFDEHKALIGFTSQEQALEVYDQSFVDGRGAQRVGGVTEMSVEEFKTWVREGKTRGPLAAQTTQQPPVVQAQAQTPETPQTLEALNQQIEGQATATQGQVSRERAEAESATRLRPTAPQEAPGGMFDTQQDLALGAEVEGQAITPERLAARLGPQIDQMRSIGTEDAEIDRVLRESLGSLTPDQQRAVIGLMDQEGTGSLVEIVDRVEAQTNAEQAAVEEAAAQEASGQRGTVDIQRRIFELGGIRLRDTQGNPIEGQLAGELREFLMPQTRTGRRRPSRMINNRQGLTPQEMAEQLAEEGFLATADTGALVRALDRAVTQGQSVRSGDRIPAQEDPRAEIALPSFSPWVPQTSDIQAAFPGQEVTQLENGDWVVNTPAGIPLTIRLVGQIQMGEALTRRALLSHGMDPDSQAVRDAMDIFGPRGLTRARGLRGGNATVEIQLARGQATLFTLRHEQAHFLEVMGFLSPLEIRTLTRAAKRLKVSVGKEDVERRADLVAQEVARLEGRLGSSDSSLGRVIRKVQQFFDSIARFFGARTTGGMIRDIQRGTVFVRPPITFQPQQAGAQNASIDLASVERTIPTTIEGVQLQHTDKPFMEYQLAAGIAEASGVGQDRMADAAFRKLKITMSNQDEIAQGILLRWMTTPGDFNRFLRDIKKPEFTPSSSAIFAFAKLEQSMLHDALVKLNDGQIDQAEFDRRREAVVKLSVTVPGTSEAGRILRMSQAPFTNPGTLRFADYLRRLEKIKERDLTPEEYQRALDRFTDVIQQGDPRAMLGLFEETTDPRLIDLYWEFYYGGLLSGIPTQTVNALGTLMNVAFHDIVVEGTAVMLDAVTAGITGRQRTKYLREIPAGFNETWRNMGQAYKDAWYWWKSPLPQQVGGEGQLAPLSPRLGRLGLPRRVQLDVGAPSWQRATPESFPEALPQAAREGMAKFMNAFSPFMGAASRALQAADVAAKSLAFDATVARLATREAINRGITDPAQQKAFVEDAKRNLEQYPEFEVEARRIAEDRTFNDAPSRLAEGFLRSRNAPGLTGFFLRMMIPFASTPDRLIARGLELVPGIGIIPGVQERGLTYRGFLPELVRGNEKALEVGAKQLIGLALTMLVYQLWDDEKITGPLSRNPAQRDSELRRGLIPHAVILNGQAFEFRRFEPLSLPIGAATAAFEALRELENRRRLEGLDPAQALNEDGAAIVQVAVGNMARYLLDSSYFSGLAGFFQSVSRSGGGIQHGLTRQLVSATLPFVSLQRNLARTFEASGLLPGTEEGRVAVRESRTIGESFGRGIPGVANQIKPRLDVFGRPIRTFASAPEALASPLRRAEVSRDPVELAMAKVQYFPGTRSKRSLQQSVGRRITDQELQGFLERRGQLARQELEQIVGSQFFERLTDDRKRSRMRAAFSRASRRARRELFGREGRGGRTLAVLGV